MTWTPRTAWSAVPLHHLISLDALLGCQQTINLRVDARVVNRFIRHQLRLLIGEGTHRRLIKLAACGGRIDLLANIVEFRVPLFFRRMLSVQY
jgi:hypothetical protein